ncbi:MAG: hypothetical protein GX894_01395 [Clostridia bacterium]|jgi:hypothetical protein|nr:hypothetical protein [Clostridia bacterium]
MAREEKTEQAPKKGPSPILLVLLVAALGFVVFDFLTRERSTEKAPRQSSYTKVPRVVPPLPEEEKKTEVKRAITARPARDPFQPPARVARAMAATAERRTGGQANASDQVITTVKEVISALVPGGGSTPGSRSDPGGQLLLPVWTGTIATAEERVVIIRHNEKSYILQLGETLPGTDYRLVEIRQEAVVLQAPGGRQLRLRRIEEAK